MKARPEVWTLPAAARRAVLAHAREARPEECCGVLVGTRRNIAFAAPMRNVATDRRRRYQLDDAEHIAIRQWLRTSAPAMGIVGVYHSHPASAARPSATDLAEAHYPEWLYLIAGRAGTRAVVKGFRINDGAAREVLLRRAPLRPRPAR